MKFKVILVFFSVCIFPFVCFSQKPPKNYTGRWITRYENGQIKTQASFDIGKEVGECVNYFKSGNIELIGKYIDGKEDGEWFCYYENEKLRSKIIYEKGVIVKRIDYDEHGNKKQ